MRFDYTGRAQSEGRVKCKGCFLPLLGHKESSSIDGIDFCQCPGPTHHLLIQSEETNLSKRRILELELEVKRLREGLQKSKIEYWACFVNTDPKMTVHEFDDSIDKVLSAPPPALAEAYAELRSVATAVVRSDPGYLVLRNALAEIARLEKGE